MEEPRTLSLIKLIKTGRQYSYVKRQLIQSSDIKQSLCLVKRGYVKRYMISNEGSIGIQSIYGPGAFFPLTRIYELLFDYKLYEGPETYYYEAMCDTDIYALEDTVLMEALQKNPLLYRDLLFFAGRRFRSNIHRLENASMRSAYHRVAHQLAFFAHNSTPRDTNEAVIKIPLTQQDLADSLNTTRETVSVAISALREKGLIKTGKYITVPNIKKLEDEAYS